MRVLPVTIPLRIVATPSGVVLNNEDTMGLRIVPIGANPSPPGRDGVTSGRWEGDTLVIETDRFWEVRMMDQIGRSVVVGPGTKIVERLSVVPGASGDVLLYRFAVEDSRFYTRPWRGEFTLNRFDRGDSEYACHEGNRSLTNSLLGGRVADKRKTTGQKRPGK